MTFILHEQRGADGRLAFELYRKYLAETKHVLHEIEWGNGARWLIQCRDVEHRYTPNKRDHRRGMP